MKKNIPKIAQKQTCVDCHFFMVDLIDLSSPPSPDIIDTDRRVKCKKNDFSWVRPDHSMQCYFGVWDQGFHFNASEQFKLICETSRKDFCFFFKYRPGMLLPAAKRIQKRMEGYRKARKDRRLTIGGLWIAGIALLINAALEIWNMLCK